MEEQTLNEAKKDYHAPMHSAEHILNQTMIRMFACGRSIRNHIEKKKSKCDYKFDRNLTVEEIAAIETKVNEVIALNLDVKEEIVSLEEAREKYNVSKLPDDAGNAIRIITIGEYDACPCIGAHVSNTSEIGKFKIASSDYNDCILRIRYKLEN